MKRVLTEEQVLSIMARLLAGGESQGRIAKDMGCSRTAINYIWVGKAWAYLFQGKSRAVAVRGEAMKKCAVCRDGRGFETRPCCSCLQQKPASVKVARLYGIKPGELISERERRQFIMRVWGSQP